MSDVPELRELVRAVAERQSQRRRARIVLRVAIPAVAAAAVIALLPGADRPDEEVPSTTTPAPTQTPTPNPFTPTLRDPATPPASLPEARAQAEKLLGLFRDPARAADRPSSRPKPTARGITEQPDWERARRVTKRGDIEQFVMPGLWDGLPGLCTAGQVKGHTLTVGCSPGFPTLASPLWSRTSSRQGPIYFVMFPDGVDRITLHLKSGEKLKRRIRNNTLQFQQRGLQEVTWLDASGRKYRKRLVV
jgi:hypothetical protein